MPNLIDKRVLFFSGKGGVGKSTLAWAAGLCAARLGKRVLIMEIFPSNYPKLFGANKLEYAPKRMTKNLWAMRLDPYDALEEYLTRLLKFKPMVKMFLRNKVFRSLADVAPAWRELITLGKVWYAESAPHRHPFDMFIVDVPATGHGISLFKVPKAVLKTLGMSPIRTHTLAVQHLITDPTRTRICIVAIPEELAIKEALELLTAATEEIGLHKGRIFLNMVPPRFNRNRNRMAAAAELAQALDIKEPDKIVEASEHIARWRRRAEEYAKYLNAKLKEYPTLIPYIPEEMSMDGLMRIARAMEPAFLGSR